jgi:hypothetical protein
MFNFLLKIILPIALILAIIYAANLIAADAVSAKAWYWAAQGFGLAAAGALIVLIVAGSPPFARSIV